MPTPRTLSRRDLLASAAAGVTLATLSVRPAFAEDAPAPAQRVRIGFLGASHSHGIEKVKTVQQSADYELVGACEDSAGVRANLEKLGVKLLAQNDLFAACQVVAVESDVKDHERHAQAALDAGKHIHVEKPPADTLAAFQKMVATAKEKKLLLQTGYMWRYNPGMNAAIEAARKGWLGEVFLVRGTINTQIGANQRPDWAQFRGGTMFELGSHLVDALVRLMGKPDKVTPFLKKHADLPDTLADDTAAVFEFPRALGIITSATPQHNAGGHRYFEILGTNGVATVKPIEQPVLQIDLGKAAGPYAAGSQKVQLPPYRRYVPEFADLAACIRTGKSLPVTLDEELVVQEALLQACGM